MNAPAVLVVVRNAALESLPRSPSGSVVVQAFRPALAVEASGGLLDQPRAAAAEQAAAALSMKAQPVFTYLVNAMKTGDREVPYSLVTATDLRSIVLST